MSAQDHQVLEPCGEVGPVPIGSPLVLVYGVDTTEVRLRTWISDAMQDPVHGSSAVSDRHPCGGSRVVYGKASVHARHPTVFEPSPDRDAAGTSRV